ncbi:MAG: 2-C-methyl-D-erythritol 2,4-cyclodiphosphate synthase [Thermoanaerobaculum sp.]|nr:2-C-methyl-D-erythritol 2,4-cyclodiphosphate synthase [Thermoanaerobaculum sp.]MDW7966619.1 2-C-methyl-D-erythritol 2,4-cyclodiphosphate synthase [Thermoanaerobaculum sp.]
MNPQSVGEAVAQMGVVVAAAGSSRRFGSDKLAVPLRGMTVLQRAVACLRSALPQVPTVVVVRPEDLPARREELTQWGPLRVVPGGAQRQDSVRHGVEALDLDDEALVVIHDGARPFVPPEDVRRVVQAAQGCGAAVLAAPVGDTVKEVTDQGEVVRTWPRERLVRSLTPQVFRVGLLRRAWAAAGGESWTDEAALLESQGFKVMAVPGDPRNLKVTQPEDVSLLAGLFPPDLRVGQGFDVHPLVPGRPLVLAGIPIPHERGLAGHSDADVVLHAVTDALLGACGEGDIGLHFPPTDPQWAGAPSRRFVEFALTRAEEKGWRVVNCDLTVLAEEPRLAPYRSDLVASLAQLLALPPSAVNVKATTTEGLGFVGRGEGIAATAVVLLARR